MASHAMLMRSVTVAVERAGFVVTRIASIRGDGTIQDELHLVRADRVDLLPSPELVWGSPRGLYTRLVVTSAVAAPESQLPDPFTPLRNARIDLSHQVPFLAAIPRDKSAAVTERLLSYVIQTMGRNSVDTASVYDMLFAARCVIMLAGGRTPTIEIALEHELTLDESDGTIADDDLLVEAADLAGTLARIWDILAPPTHSRDPLTPLSFLWRQHQ